MCTKREAKVSIVLSTEVETRAPVTIYITAMVRIGKGVDE